MKGCSTFRKAFKCCNKHPFLLVYKLPSETKGAMVDSWVITVYQCLPLLISLTLMMVQ